MAKNKKNKSNSPKIPNQNNPAKAYQGNLRPANELSEVMLQASVMHRSGPLPVPEELAAYDSIVPGAANRIITMAENQALHRQKSEMADLEADILISKLGLYFGFACFVIPFVISLILVMYGQGEYVKLFLGVSIISVIPSFLKLVKNRNNNK